MLLLIGVLLVTISLSFIHEKWLRPIPPSLTIKTIALQSLLVSIVYLVLSLIVQRPVFSALTVLIFLIILIAVSNAKFTALKEPMVFSDFAMFAQAFKHPRLYFPFLGLAPVIIAPLLIITLIFLVLYLEPALPFTLHRVLSTLIAIGVFYFASKKIALQLTLTQSPEVDNEKFGLQNSLYAYLIQSKTTSHQELIRKTLDSAPFNSTKEGTPPHFLNVLADTEIKQRPNITVIQSESFFDARRIHSIIKPGVLKNFDRINAESCQFGKLQVPAWGANTMRSEFAFLTGISHHDLGFYRYYPYQFFKNRQISSIASALQQQGYYCVCIHPHHGSFFGRDKLFPNMGFDEFIGIECFEGDEKFGPYISDQSVSNKILEITKEYIDKPLFILAITMENHGPLYLEKTSETEHDIYYHDKSDKGLPNNINDLTVYLRHLKNADTMIKTLTDNYRQANKETTLCFYGDHIPSMPQAYKDTHYQDSDSDYFIWQSHQLSNTSKPLDINIESLAMKLCEFTTQKH